MNSLTEKLNQCGSLDAALDLILGEFAADSGTIHMIGDDGILHLKAASGGIPDVVLNLVRQVPIGKGMAGLIDLCRKGHFKKSDTVVFLHTGGSVALFGYNGVFDGTRPN